MITLNGHGYKAEILPELGGAIASLSFHNKAVLRPAPAAPGDAGETGCFPLVPYANRIADGVLRFGGREIRLPRTFPDHPHALHGDGWRARWLVSEAREDFLLLRYDHDADVWPWAYRATQLFALSAGGLNVHLTLENCSDTPMPFSLGLHPWFVRSPATVLYAQVDGVWLADETMLPTVLEDGTHFFHLADGAALKEAPFVDNCHTGWRGPAVIESPDQGLKVTLTAAPQCPFLHIYAPVGSDFVCAEPVTAMPDAFSREEPAAETGARVLAPGAHFAMDMTIRAEEI